MLPPFYFFKKELKVKKLMNMWIELGPYESMPSYLPQG
jgi:hypothetical protein